MTPNPRPDDDRDAHDEPPGGTLAPLPGEPGIPPVGQRTRAPWSRKGLLAAALLVGTIVTVAAVSIHRFAAGALRSPHAAPPRSGDIPAAASRPPRALELGNDDLPRGGVPRRDAPAEVRVPAVVPTADELAEPIGVRRAGGPGAAREPMAPEDAPVVIVSTRPDRRSASSAAAPGAGGHDEPAPAAATSSLQATQRNLDAYQQHLQGLLQTLTRTTQRAAGASPDAVSPDGGSANGAPTGGPPNGGPPSGGLHDAQPAQVTPAAGTGARPAAAGIPASRLAQRSLTLPRGTAFTCALKTRMVSAASGPVACQVQRNVYGDDGRVLLIERGSHLDGEYRIASLQPGSVRIPVLWSRLRTPHGVVVDLAAPATGPLGEAGVPGHVDRRWGERIGAAMLLSLIDDAVKLVIRQQAADSGADTIVVPGTAADTSKLAEKVLDSTIHIPPLIYQNQGGLVGVVVSRDVDFSGVYELAPVPR